MRHRWSGWPGAWCLDCGISDPGEANDASPEGIDCYEPGSHRHDPYCNYGKDKTAVCWR